MRNPLLYLMDIIFPRDLTRKDLVAVPTTTVILRSQIFPTYPYQHPTIKKAVRILKNRRDMELARWCGKLMYEHFLEYYGNNALMKNLESRPLVIPVPIHSTKLKSRGFNQAELLASAFAQISGWEYAPKVIKKIKESPKQALSSRSDRLKNVQGLYITSDPKKIKNRTCIIIDDVATTGATIQEIMRILKTSDSGPVLGVVLAH